MAAVKIPDLVKAYNNRTTNGDFSDWFDKLELVAKLQEVKNLRVFLTTLSNWGGCICGIQATI